MVQSDERDLIAFLKVRDERRKQNWTIALIVAVMLSTVGFAIGKTIKDNADERRQQEQEVDGYVCALSDRNCDD